MKKEISSKTLNRESALWRRLNQASRSVPGRICHK